MKEFFLILILTFTFSFGIGQTSDTGFVAFWTKFHLGIIDRDYNALSAKTKFPIKVKRESDYTTIDEYTIKDFKKVFSKFLSAVNPGHPQTRYDWLKTFKLKPSFDKKPEKSIRIENMMFKKEQGGWCLVQIYEGHSEF